MPIPSEPVPPTSRPDKTREPLRARLDRARAKAVRVLALVGALTLALVVIVLLGYGCVAVAEQATKYDADRAARTTAWWRDCRAVKPEFECQALHAALDRR